jgi:hypothetical protein
LPDPERAREFEVFRAETSLQIAHLREMVHRLMPIHEARSGDRAEMSALQHDVTEIKDDVAAVRRDVKALTDSQRRMIAVLLALQVVGGLLMWLSSTGLLQIGGPP